MTCRPGGGEGGGLVGSRLGVGNLVLQNGCQIYHRKSGGSNSSSNGSSDTSVESPTVFGSFRQSSHIQITTAQLTRCQPPPPPTSSYAKP